MYKQLKFLSSHSRKILMLIVLILLILCLRQNSNNQSICFFQTFNNRKVLLPNILESWTQPKNGNNIFFHETSCSSDGVVKLNARQACAVESAALANPGINIFLLFAAAVGFNNKTDLPIIEAILSYNNVHLNYLNITQYSMNTPLHQWIKDGELFKSSYLNSHLSDVLRYLSLYKYGGTYLDLDVIVRKPLNTIVNYAGAESNNFVAAGIINLEENRFGHQIAEMCLKELLYNFDGRDWGANGPGVLTRVLKNICQTKSITKMMDKSRCYGFNVLPINDCYNIGWQEYQYFFLEEHLNETLSRVYDSLITHVWNKHSETAVLRTDANVAYIHLARKFCPKVLIAAGSYF